MTSVFSNSYDVSEEGRDGDLWISQLNPGYMSNESLFIFYEAEYEADIKLNITEPTSFQYR